MPADMEPSIETLVARRQPGYSLEAPFYASQAVFDLDMDVIFGRHWIQVGVEPDIAEPGDCLTVDIGPHAIVVARDDDMNIRAFHNVCRHRGARLIDEPKTNVGNVVCRYHQWTYNLEGALIHAQHMAEGFDRACHGLKPVHVRSLAGLIFICLADAPPGDFDRMATDLTPYLAPHDLPGCKVAHEMELIEYGNWKLTMENNRECYHCAGNHPELTISLFAEGYGFAPDPDNAELVAQSRRYDDLVTERQAFWADHGLPAREIEHLADRVTGYRTERLPLDGAGESQTRNTKIASRKLLGGFTDPRLGGLSMWTQPNSWHHFMSDHIVSFCAIPLDPGRTLVRTKWLVRKDAVEGVDYDIDNLIAVWKATNAQDGALVGYAQAGVRTTGYRPGPYSTYTEGLVEKFTQWYVGRLAAHLGV